MFGAGIHIASQAMLTFSWAIYQYLADVSSFVAKLQHCLAAERSEC
jgi:hypothetical protein